MDINNKLMDAAKHGDLNKVKKLIKRGADIHAWDDASLSSAVENGHLEVIKFLIKRGADINARNNAPLRWAAYYGHLEVVKFLVKNGADIHDWDGSLRFASYDHLEVVKFLEPIYVKDMWNKVKWSEIKGRYNEHK